MGKTPDEMGPMTMLLSGVTVIGMLTLLIGLCLMGYWGFLKAPDQIPRPQPTALPQPALTAKLLPDRAAGSAPSVTEHTTERLEASQAPIPARDAIVRQIYEFVRMAWVTLLTGGCGLLAYFGLRLLWSLWNSRPSPVVTTDAAAASGPDHETASRST